MIRFFILHRRCVHSWCLPKFNYWIDESRVEQVAFSGASTERPCLHYWWYRHSQKENKFFIKTIYRRALCASRRFIWITEIVKHQRYIGIIYGVVVTRKRTFFLSDFPFDEQLSHFQVSSLKYHDHEKSMWIDEGRERRREMCIQNDHVIWRRSFSSSGGKRKLKME